MRIGWITRTSRFGFHGSYESHRSSRSFGTGASRFATLALILLPVAGLGLCAQPAGPQLLPEATILNHIDGEVIQADVNDTWIFQIVAEIENAGITVPAGTRFPLLPSAILERLIADVNDRYTPRYRLSASVTSYGNMNFLLPTYYLPLSKFKDPQSPGTSAEPNGVSEPAAGVVGPSDPNLTVPEAILQKLRNRRPLRGPLRRPQVQPTPTEAPASGTSRVDLGRMLVDRIGMVTKSEGRSVFIPSGLGWKIGSTQYELLPCSELERVLELQSDPLEPTRFDVAGFITRFRGREYLLLHRAIPVYNYGNFGR